MPTFADYQSKILPPPWLQGSVGSAWLSAFGTLKDQVADEVKQAVKARMVDICPADAVPVLGRERGLERGYTEPEDSYRARIKAAWDVWQWAGTAYGVLTAARIAGYPNVVLQTQTARQYQLASTLTGDPSQDLVIATMPGTVHLGGSPENWSDFAALIMKPWPSWWSGAPADGSQDQLSFARLLSTWKAAHTRCVSLKVCDGVAWGVNMTWGSFIWGQGTVTVWSPPA